MKREPKILEAAFQSDWKNEQMKAERLKIKKRPNTEQQWKSTLTNEVHS